MWFKLMWLEILLIFILGIMFSSKLQTIRFESNFNSTKIFPCLKQMKTNRYFISGMKELALQMVNYMLWSSILMVEALKT